MCLPCLLTAANYVYKNKAKIAVLVDLFVVLMTTFTLIYTTDQSLERLLKPPPDHRRPVLSLLECSAPDKFIATPGQLYATDNGTTTSPPIEPKEAWRPQNTFRGMDIRIPGT